MRRYRPLENAIRLNPADNVARFEIGRILVKTGQTIDAISQFREIIRGNPEDVDALVGLGNSILIQAIEMKSFKSIQLAEENLKKAFFLKPSSLPAVLGLIEVNRIKIKALRRKRVM